MEKNCLKFTCDDRIVNQLVRTNEYRVMIGNKLKSEWQLHIFQTTLRISDCLDFYCQFNLIRGCIGNSYEPTVVSVKFFEDSICFFETEATFDNETKKIKRLEFGGITIARLKASKIEIVFFFKQNVKSQTPIQDVTFKKPNSLRDDFLCLLREEHLADVTLKCGSETVNAHKVVLCARSPVFKAMFSNEMQESKTNTVTIEDMDTSSFHAWVDFVYGSEVKMSSPAFACDLLNAAEKYQMKGLKEVCIEYLESILSSENAVQLLEIANLYDDHFKTKVISYVSGHLSDLKTSKDWKDLKSRKPALALEVYSYNEQ